MMIVISLAIALSAIFGTDESHRSAPWSRVSEVSPNGANLALGLTDGELILVDVGIGEVKCRIPGDGRSPESVAWSPDGGYVAVLDEEGRVRVRRGSDGAIARQFSTTEQRLSSSLRTARSVHFAAKGEIIVVACGPYPAQLWRWREAELVGQLQLTPGNVATACSVAADGELVALGDIAGSVGVWKAATGEGIGGAVHVTEPVGSLAFDPSGRRLAVGAGDSKALIFSVPDLEPLGEIVHCTKPIFGVEYQIGRLAFSPAGDTLITSSCGFWEVCAWDLASGKKLWSYDYGGGNPSCVSAYFDPTGSSVTLACRGVVLEARSGAKLHVLDSGGREGPWVKAGAGIAWIERGGRLSVFQAIEGSLRWDLTLGGGELGGGR